MLGVFASSLIATLLAEVIGDKTLYTAGALSGAHRPGPVIMGAGIAAGLKMAVAVAAGGLLAGLPPWLLNAIGAVTWIGIAIAVWRRPAHADTGPAPLSGPRLVGTSFAAVFLTEWGDPGQVVAGVLAARTGAPAVVWAAGTTAMIIKIVAGVGVARLARGQFSPGTFRIAGTVLFLIFGALAMFGEVG